MSIAAAPIAMAAISEAAGSAAKLPRPPSRRQAIARADATMRPEPR